MEIPGQFSVEINNGTPLGYGYRGTPEVIDLGFDASADFHVYCVEWTPERLTWFVDGNVVYQRESWGPTPIPHLPMRLHANLWAPRSIELAGKLQLDNLPLRSTIRRIIYEETCSNL